MIKLLVKRYRWAILWLTIIVVSLSFSLLVLAAFPFVWLLDRERHALHSLAIVWARSVLAVNPWWQFKIEGLENLVPDGSPVVYVANHQSQSDILVIYKLGMRFRWLSKASVFRIPFVGWAMKAVGYISVDRKSPESRVRCMVESRKKLEHGTPVLFFPEGTRSEDGSLGSFKPGAFKLARDAGVPVIPITILGTNELLPKGSIFPQNAFVRIVVHAPIDPTGLSLSELTRKARETVASALPEDKRGVARERRVPARVSSSTTVSV